MTVSINNHPRRTAREVVLKALYAEQFSESEAPDIILERILKDGFNKTLFLFAISLTFFKITKLPLSFIKSIFFVAILIPRLLS